MKVLICIGLLVNVGMAYAAALPNLSTVEAAPVESEVLTPAESAYYGGWGGGGRGWGGGGWGDRGWGGGGWGGRGWGGGGWGGGGWGGGGYGGGGWGGGGWGR